MASYLGGWPPGLLARHVLSAALIPPQGAPPRTRIVRAEDHSRMGSCVLERPPGISAGRWPAGSSQTVRVMGCRDRAGCPLRPPPSRRYCLDGRKLGPTRDGAKIDGGGPRRRQVELRLSLVGSDRSHPGRLGKWARGCAGELRHTRCRQAKAEEGRAGGGGTEGCWPDTCIDLTCPADVSHQMKVSRTCGEGWYFLASSPESRIMSSNPSGAE